MKETKRRRVLSGLLLGALLLLCGTLGVLQYRWIGAVSRVERDRLQANLQADLERLSDDLSLTIAVQIRALLPQQSGQDPAAAEAAIAGRYREWKQTARRARIFSRVAMAGPGGETASLRVLDMDKGVFTDAGWPGEWKTLRDRAETRREPAPGDRRGPPGPPPDQPGMEFEVPLFGASQPPGPFERGAPGRVIFELDLAYLREVLLPELFQRYLGSGGRPDYEVAVLTRGGSPDAIFPADLGQALRIAGAADGSIPLLAPQALQVLRPWGPAWPPEAARGGARGRAPGAGRWEMFVRHRAGSLEAVVAAARRRNLAVTGGVLLLLVAGVAALVRFTRRAQRLAELQMDFVAGVSHELRTPLTVIHTAAYNLRGKLARDPAQVEKYGALIQRESGRLADMVEQVMQFAGAEAGRAIGGREPLAVETVIDEAVEASRSVIENAGCTLERNVDPDLPPVLADPAALKRALENLLSNAARHGSGQAGWVGISASRAGGTEEGAVEIRIGDRGPGIPADEQRLVFDPFFRGRRAVRDQVLGSGLGLNLVKRIVEAHGGSVRVTSEPGKLTEFVVRLPALTGERRDELAHSAD